VTKAYSHSTVFFKLSAYVKKNTHFKMLTKSFSYDVLQVHPLSSIHENSPTYDQILFPRHPSPPYHGYTLLQEFPWLSKERSYLQKSTMWGSGGSKASPRLEKAKISACSLYSNPHNLGHTHCNLVHTYLH
jgi:hypothetical protein